MIVAAGMVMLLLTALTLGVVGLIVLLLLLPVLVYLGIRLQFWTLAIFDGFGITDALHATWTIDPRQRAPGVRVEAGDGRDRPAALRRHVGPGPARSPGHRPSQA